MAKGDFELDEQEYDVVYEEKKSKKSSKSKKKTVSSSKSKPVMDTPIEDTSDLGDFANINVIEDEKPKEDLIDKTVKAVKNTNIRTVIVIFGVVLISFVITLVITISIYRINKSYTSDIIIPDVLYVGEGSGISVYSKYTGETPSRRDITKTISTFDVENKDVIEVVSESSIGAQVINGLIPKQEGKTTIEVISSLDGKKLNSLKKDVIVCPSFGLDSLLFKNISIPLNGTYQIKMDTEYEECLKGITYSSQNDKVAVADENGLVTAFGVGDTSIIVKKGNKSFSIKTQVTEENVALEDANFDDSSIQLTEGESYRLSLAYLPENASNFSTQFKSSDESIATVSEAGLVTAVAPGTATVKLSSPSLNPSLEVNVLVTSKNVSETEITSFDLDRTSIDMIQGEVSKVFLVTSPDGASKGSIKWQSSDENVVHVTGDGVLYARGQGEAIVEVYLANDFVKQISVFVKKVDTPIVSPSDNILSDHWHNKPYILNFPELKNGMSYYIGTSTETVTNNKLVISKDGVSNYYIRACSNICSEICSKENGTNKCEAKCAPQPLVCSDSYTYISKLDATKPVIKSVTPVVDNTGSGTVQILAEDKTSSVEKWCVSDNDSYAGCIWKNFKSGKKATANFVTYKNGVYYAFAKDSVGNISKSHRFEINDID